MATRARVNARTLRTVAAAAAVVLLAAGLLVAPAAALMAAPTLALAVALVAGWMPGNDVEPNQNALKDRFAFVDRYTAKPVGDFRYGQFGAMSQFAPRRQPTRTPRHHHHAVTGAVRQHRRHRHGRDHHDP